MKVIPFKNIHQPMVDLMLTEVQKEFNEPFTSSSSKRMIDANKVLGSRFWVIMDKDVLAGTVGFIKMKNASCALKSLFTLHTYRGTGAADLLLETVCNYAKRKKIKFIYLGTMQQMKAAQKFYVKRGFVQIEEKDLPKDFPANILDTVFYKFEV